MRIAFFSDNYYPELSGIADTIMLTGAELARRGHEIDYFVPSYSRKNYAIAGAEHPELDMPHNVRVHRLWSFAYKSPTMQGRAALPNAMRAAFSRKKFDVLHSHSFFGPGFEALWRSKFHGIPLVGTNNTLIESFVQYSPVKSQWAKDLIPKYVVWYFNRCDLAIAPSQFLIDDMRAKGLRVPAKAVSNPIDGPFFESGEDKSALKKKLGLLQFTVLYAGRIASEKNVDVLLEAFIAFAENVPDASLVIAGEGSLRAKLEERAKASRVGSRIQFTGLLMGARKHLLFEHFYAADVFVMPSTSETQSMVTLQAMAGGLPVIVAEAGALPELASTDRGLIFKPGDSRALRLHLEALYSNPDLRYKIGKQAIDYARARTTKNIANEWEQIYNELIKRFNAKV